MSNLQKFEDTVQELEREMFKHKEITSSYQKLKDLVKSYGIISEQFDKNSKSLENFAYQQQLKQKELEQGMIDLHLKNQDANEELRKQNELLGNNLTQGINTLSSENQHAKEELRIQNESFEKAVANLIDRFRQENKSFYFDLEKTVKIKLDESKSEIKRLIEDERQKIREIFVNELSIGLQGVLSKQKRMQVILVVFGILLTLLSSAILIKLLR